MDIELEENIFKKVFLFNIVQHGNNSNLQTIQLQYALAFRKLLKKNVKAKEKGNGPFNIVTNTNQLADAIQKRPAAISDIFTAKWITNGLTIVQAAQIQRIINS